MLFIVYLISLFIPEIPHPIGIFHGDKGAAKTSVTKAIKKVIDPSIVETTNMPKEQIDMIQQLNNNYLIAYDNLSTLQEWQSDLLCRAVTGEGSAKRKLFTDSDDILFSFRRCVILNGINIVATRADLLDRALLFELERITEEMRLEETQLWENFNADLPEILGGMFNIISKAIPIYSTSKLKKLHRLADFTHWGYAIAEAMKQGEGDVFLKDYEENLKEQNVEVINSHPLAKVILEFMKNQNEWEGTIESLLVHLKERATEIGIDTKSKAFPTASNYLSNQLNRLKSNLEAEGIYYTKGGRKCYGIPCRLSKTKPAIEPIPEQVELLRPWEKQCSLSVDDM
ncbi:MAG: hypothetical protein FIA99_08675 [Ruminiclostridium sp.]|nr:hypothetical protein [Ruminiclostridium sp.]